MCIRDSVGLVAICLLPVLPRLPYHTAGVETPSLFSSSAVRAIPSGSRALTFPWDAAPNNDAMMWQVASDMRFKILGGYAIVAGAGSQPVSLLLPSGSLAVQHLLLEGTEYSGPEPADDSATRAEMCIRDSCRAALACHAGRWKRLSRSGRSPAHGADPKCWAIVIGC